MIFTSQGIPFFHGGQEILRSKLDPDNVNGVDHNSYDSGDLTNQFDWSRKEQYADTFKYYQGLIALRKGHEAFRMETMKEIQKGLIFIQEDIDYLLGFKLVEQDGTDPWKEIVVIFNANQEAKTVKIDGVNAKWVVVVDGNHAGVTPLAQTDVKLGDGTVTVPGLSAVVIHR
jgi:pullulanase